MIGTNGFILENGVESEVPETVLIIKVPSPISENSPLGISFSNCSTCFSALLLSGVLFPASLLEHPVKLTSITLRIIKPINNDIFLFIFSLPSNNII